MNPRAGLASKVVRSLVSWIRLDKARTYLGHYVVKLNKGCIIVPLAISALIGPDTQAQVWAPSSGEWYYDWWTLTQTGYVSMTRSGDTVITGVSCQKLEVMRNIHDYPSNSGSHQHIGTYFTSVNGSLVSIWNGNSFDTLYWFGSGPGDRWTVPLLDTPVKVIVADTGTVPVDGTPLKYLTVAYGSGQSAGDTIFERFGSRMLFIDAGFTVLQIDGPITGLRCYRDDQVDYTTGIAEYCDFITGLHGSPSTSSVRAWPTPFKDQLTVDGAKTGFLELFDLTGRRVLGPTQFQGAPLTLNVDELMPGMYALRIRNGLETHAIRVLKE